MSAVLVTKESHPALYQALENLSHDSGGGAGHPSYAVPAPWSEKVPAAEAALAQLTEPDLCDFSIGSTDDQAAVAEKNPGLDLVAELLNAFFEGWSV